MKRKGYFILEVVKQPAASVVDDHEVSHDVSGDQVLFKGEDMSQLINSTGE